MLKYLAIAMLSLSLAGCVAGQSGQVKITVDSSRLKPALRIAKPGAIKLERVKWIVVSKQNASTVLDSIGGNGMVVALTPDGFSKLQRNNAKLLSLVKRYRKIVLAYEAHDR